MVDYTYPTQSTWQAQSTSVQISSEAFSALFETMQKETLRNEVNRIMEEANKDEVMTASDVYHECADELRWLANNLDKAVGSMMAGEMVAGGVRLQRVLDRMREVERKWWAIAEKTEEMEKDTKKSPNMPRYELKGDDWENGWKLREESDE